MKTRSIIAALAVTAGAATLAGCGGQSGTASSGLPDCRTYRAAISRAYADPESTVAPTGLKSEDAAAVTKDRQAFQSAVAGYAQQDAADQKAHDAAVAAVAAGSTDLGDQLASLSVPGSNTAQNRQRLTPNWQAYVDQEIPRVMSRQGCAS